MPQEVSLDLPHMFRNTYMRKLREAKEEDADTVDTIGEDDSSTKICIHSTKKVLGMSRQGMAEECIGNKLVNIT